AHDELDHRVRQRTAELEQAMQYLMQREKLAALGQMAAGVAHELNTPIGNARLAASLILEESDGFRGLLQAPALRRGQVEQFVSKIGEN
ncbi:histidine kinase dimerization/phospho-acceptor domain-containing protein, partial [Acinetobacter baumannii]